MLTYSFARHPSSLTWNVSFLRGEDVRQFFASVAELGEDAGRITWNNAVEMGKQYPLVQPDQVAALKRVYKEYGAWEDEDIEGWDIDTLNGMVIQEAASRFRDFLSCKNYREYRKREKRGEFSYGLWKDGKTGQWFLDLTM